MIICPRCKTKNNKKSLKCHHCKAPLKPRKKASLLSTNPKSKIDLKVILLGVVIFIATTMIIYEVALDYSFMISGFTTMLYLYFAFKNTPIPESSNTLRGIGLKMILHYIIAILIGSVVLLALGYV